MNQVIEIRMQRHTWDCALTCMEMLLAIPYADLRACVRGKNPTGVSPDRMQRIAKKFGHTLRWKDASFMEEDDCGILVIEDKPPEEDSHVVIYAKDTIYDPANNQWWFDADEYLGAKGYTKIGLLMRKDNDTK